VLFDEGPLGLKLSTVAKMRAREEMRLGQAKKVGWARSCVYRAVRRLLGEEGRVRRCEVRRVV
jgi:hypothetical protein